MRARRPRALARYLLLGYGRVYIASFFSFFRNASLLCFGASRSVKMPKKGKFEIQSRPASFQGLDSSMAAETRAVEILVDVYLKHFSQPEGLASNCRHNIFARSSGTTATETPGAGGKFAEPVYFDWHANWPRVRQLFAEAETQRVLHLTIARARGPAAWGQTGTHDYYVLPYEGRLMYPYWHLSQARCGNGEELELIAELLRADPPEWEKLLASALPTLRDIAMAFIEDAVDEDGFNLDQLNLPFNWRYLSDSELASRFKSALEDDPGLLNALVNPGSGAILATQAALMAFTFPWLRRYLDHPLLLLCEGQGGPTLNHHTHISTPCPLTLTLAQIFRPLPSRLRLWPAAHLQARMGALAAGDGPSHRRQRAGRTNHERDTRFPSGLRGARCDA